MHILHEKYCIVHNKLILNYSLFYFIIAQNARKTYKQVLKVKKVIVPKLPRTNTRSRQKKQKKVCYVGYDP